MKKLVILFLFNILFIPNVKSLNWESDIPSNENIIIEKMEERYRWYKLRKVNERVENSNENNCEYFDEIVSTFSEWSNEIPEEKTNRIVEIKEEIIVDEYDTISLEKFLTSNLLVREIKIKNSKNEIIPYTIPECRNCGVTYTKHNYLYDNDMNTAISINNNTVIRIKLNKAYSENLRIELYYETTGVIFGWTTSLVYNSNKLIKKIEGNEKNMYYVYSYATSQIIIPVNATWEYYSSNINKLYRYKDEMVNCYEYEKDYIDGYFTNVNDYIKDIESKKTFYQYKNYSCEYPYISESRSTNFDSQNNVFSSVIDDTKDEVAINVSTKKQSKDFKLIPLFIVALGGILILLVLICLKMKKNMEECR